MINSVNIGGRLVADPEVRRTQSGVAVASFRIACERDFKPKDAEDRGVDYINCVAWRGDAEFIERYFSKGRVILVSGRLEQRDFTDKNGNKRQVHEVVAEHVYFGDSKYEGKREDKKEFAVIDDDDAVLPF